MAGSGQKWQEGVGVALTDFDLQLVGHCRWSAAKSLERAAVIVELHPVADTRAGLRPGLPSVEMDALIFQGSPQALNEDVVQIAALAIHRDADTGPAQAICPGKRRELGPLIAVHDVRRSEPIDRLVLRLDAEVGLQRIRYPPR